jgi:hypothetical protein
VSTTERPPTQPRRPRTLQDDLLDDLRQAAPMPVPRPSLDLGSEVGPEVGPDVVSDPERPASAPAGPQESTEPEALTVEVRVTPRRWTAPGLRTPARGTGLVATAGPLRLQVQFVGFRR